MRPKYLEIEGLQSYREIQKIDFDTLGETGLFGIFGPTGCGKSTVLDAITLALYGKVKRAVGGTQGIINSSCNKLRVSFTFELLKNDGRRKYKVEREYKRKKDSASSCEAKVARLIEVLEEGEMPIRDKVNEVNKAVEELIGLGYEDFTRAVVLPQNSFQEFLMLKNSDRRSMLERIFYLEEYGGKLFAKVNKKIEKLESKITSLKGQIMAYEDADDEAVLKAKSVMEECINEKNEIERSFNKLELRHKEAQEVWKLTQDLDLVLNKLKELDKLKNTIDKKSFFLEKVDKAESIIDEIKKRDSIKSEIDLKIHELDKLVEEMDETDRQFQKIKTDKNKIEKEAQENLPKIYAMLERLNKAKEYEQEIYKQNQILEKYLKKSNEIELEIKDKTENIKCIKDELNKYENRLKDIEEEILNNTVLPDYRTEIQKGLIVENEVLRIKENLDSEKKQINKIEAEVLNVKNMTKKAESNLIKEKESMQELEKAKQELEKMIPEELNEININNELNELKLLEIDFETFVKTRAEVEKKKEYIAGFKRQIEKITDEEIKLKKDYSEQEKNFEQSKLMLEEAESNLNKNSAVMLAKTLKEGEPCPVCGSIHHPNPLSYIENVNDLEELKKAIDIAKKKVKQNEDRLNEIKDLLARYDEKKKNLEMNIGNAESELDLLRKNYEMIVAKIPPYLKELSKEEGFNALVQQKKRIEDKKKEIEKLKQKCADIEEKIKAREESIKKINIEFEKQKSVLEEKKAVLKEKKENFDKEKENYEKKENNYKDLLNKIGIDKFSNEQDRIGEKDRKIEELKQRKEKGNQLKEKKQEELEDNKLKYNDLESEHKKIKAEIKLLDEQKSKLESQLKEIVGDKNVQDLIKENEEKINYYDNFQDQLNKEYSSLESKLNKIKQDEAALKAELNSRNKGLSEQENRVIQLIKEKGFDSETEVQNFIVSAEERNRIKEEIDNYNQEIINLTAQKKITESKLGGRKLTEEEWFLIDNDYNDLKSKKEDCFAKCEVAKNRFNDITLKNIEWKKIKQELTEAEHKAGLCEKIRSLIQAERRKDNSFIDFIAEERLRYVAAKASEILKIITLGRYALELDNESGFLIRDNSNGGIVRAVNSLSGGEIFMTSLSLALALSEQIQLKGHCPLEFFFLDEGFGTLDNNLLDTVIDALERLSSKNRVIGVISHVPELRERIARRLVIEPAYSDIRGSRVRIEKL